MPNPPSSHQPGPHLMSGDLRNRPKPITHAPRDSASATEQVGLFRVTADAMAHRPFQEDLARAQLSCHATRTSSASKSSRGRRERAEKFVQQVRIRVGIFWETGNQTDLLGGPRCGLTAGVSASAGFSYHRRGWSQNVISHRVSELAFVPVPLYTGR